MWLIKNSVMLADFNICIDSWRNLPISAVNLILSVWEDTSSSDFNPSFVFSFMYEVKDGTESIIMHVGSYAIIGRPNSSSFPVSY